jgi:thioredoxin-like negative regulator of GroEL
MAHFEMFELDDAIAAFRQSLAMEPHDVASHFFLALCYLLQDDPRSGSHLKLAYEADRKKTKQLLVNFYTLFLQNDPHVTRSQKARIEQRVKELN